MKNQNIQEEKERFVAMLDVMGTKSMVANDNGIEIYQLFKSIQSDISNFVEKSVYMIMYSDSFILYTENDSEYNYQNIVYATARLVKYSMTKGFGINGCISHGRCFCSCNKNQHITVGQPFVDAHLSQEDLFFYGIILHESALNIVKKRKYTSDFSQKLLDIVTDYKVPLKTYGWCVQYMVNWMEFIDMGNADYKIQKTKVKNIIHKLFEKYSNTGRGAVYVQNTELVMKQWYDRVKEQYSDCDWGNMLYESYLTKCPQ